MSTAEKQTAGIDPETLKDILRTVIQEARKAPEPTADEMARKASEREHREMQARLVHEREQNRIATQSYCTHIRTEDGKARTVYVQNGNFLICQACQKLIRPETDLQEFNRFFALSTNASGTTF